MRVLSDSWCFCNGGGKSERLKATIISTKSPAMAELSVSSSSASSVGAGAGAGGVSGTGFLLHRNLLLTTHVNLPSVSAAESATIRVQNGVPATLVPHRFFITSSVLDLTIVGLDHTVDGDSITQPPQGQGHQPQYLKLCSKPNLELGRVVYLLGHAEKKELTVGEGKVVIATDNLIKLSTEGFTWSPGSAGFDSQGNLSFMICDPMKLATSPPGKSSSSSSASRKKDVPMQFGIPMSVIFDWLNQHWEGSLDDLNKPKLPLMRLVSAGHKSEHSCASFTMRQVFKATEEIEGTTSSSSNTVSKPRDQPRQGSSDEEKVVSKQPHGASLVQGIPTPEIYESPKVTANRVKKKVTTQIQLLDINFPPMVSRPPTARPPQPPKELLPGSGENHVPSKEENRGAAINGSSEEAASSGLVGDGRSVVMSSSSPIIVSGVRERDEESSEGETLYSAETAESRNYSSSREGKFQFQAVGRSHSCVSRYNRWGPVRMNPVARRSSSLEKQRSFMQPRKTCSQGAPPHKAMEYFSPTFSSVMNKRNYLERQPRRPRPTAVHSSLKWNF